MKKTFLRLCALMLALIMALTVLVGCSIFGCDDQDGATDSGDNGVGTESPGNTGDAGNADNTDDSTTDDVIRITTSIYEISKHGNVILYMYGSELFDNGFEYGDILEITIADKSWDVPLCTNYSDVDNGNAVLRAPSAEDGVVLAINIGDFATTAGIAKKTAIEETPGYRWDYLIDTPVEITITMKEEGGYREQWLIRQLVRTNDRADYAHLSDAEFANFRVIATTGMGNGVLYRSASPINPELGRSTYADAAAENAGIVTVVNLADPSNTYEGTENSYYSTCNVTYVNLGMDILSEMTLSGIAEGMRFIINNNGPYLIHCNEGKDRAGFVSAMLECLMGATVDEVIDDYMVTYYNYYGVEKGTEKYDAIVNNNLIKSLNTIFKVEDIRTADLSAEAEAFLIEDAGLTADEVSALKGKLRITIDEVYESAKNFAALLGDHENVYVQATSNGALLWEQYFGREYSYCHYDAEYMNIGFEYSSLTTDHSMYVSYDNAYEYVVMLTESGAVDMKESLASDGYITFISSEVLDGDFVSIVEKDGLIIVSCTADVDELLIIGGGVISCVETYTLDAMTREMLSVKTVYTYEDGTVEEGVATISRDVEDPEGAKPFLAYEESTDLRTITIVSNVGTENERIDVIHTPKGLTVSFSPDWTVDKLFGAYSDPECTQPVPSEPDTNVDVTVYIKWDE